MSCETQRAAGVRLWGVVVALMAGLTIVDVLPEGVLYAAIGAFPLFGWRCLVQSRCRQGVVR